MVWAGQVFEDLVAAVSRALEFQVGED